MGINAPYLQGIVQKTSKANTWRNVENRRENKTADKEKDGINAVLK